MIYKKIGLDKWSSSLILLLILTFILRLPSLFEPYWYGDEGIYLTIGQALRRGLMLYRDIYDNKPPLLYLMAALAQNQVWFRAILLWWNLINVYLIYRLAYLIFQKQLAAWVASFLFILLSLVPEGNIPNSEMFMILPVTAGMLLIMQNSKINPFDKLRVDAERSRSIKIQNYNVKLKNYLLAGVLFSLAFLFKVPAGFSFAAVLTFLVFEFLQGSTLRNSRLILHQKAIIFLSLLSGFSLLPLLTIIYFWSRGILPLYLQATFKQNLGYLSSWQGGWNQSLISLSSGLTQRGLVLLAIMSVLFLLRKHFSKAFLLVAIWFFFDLFGALLSGRPYPHYLIQVAPALSLLLIFPLMKAKMNLPRPKGRAIFFPRTICSEIMEKIFVFSSLALLIFTFFYYKFWRYPVWQYYANFYQFVVGQKSKETYFAFFDNRVNETYHLSRVIKSLTQNHESIFVWGDEPYLYALSERLPPGRYTVAYHIIDFRAWQETEKALRRKSPVLIIKTKNYRRWDVLEKILNSGYIKLFELPHSVIFAKKR